MDGIQSALAARFPLGDTSGLATQLTYIRIVIHIGYQVLDQSFQRPRQEIVVMVIEPSTVVLFSLIQVPVVAAAVKHGCKGRCLWHLALRRHTREIRDNSGKVQCKGFSISQR